jgi:YrbI family 3-deoxy-D-manno-octulosonate 8-phosphate phosphatase
MPDKVVAIIPARGGSKGIPRKNVRLLNGKPLLAYTIEQATQSSFVTRAIVSTDDNEIASVAQRYGAEVVHRPAEISGDDASSESALLHALDWLEQVEGYEPELTVFLQCTAPLTLSQDIDGTVEVLLKEEADTALAVTPFHYFLWERGPNGNAVGVNHKKQVRLLRQCQEPQYLEAGAVYVMRTKQFKSVKHRFFGKTALYVMPSERRLEIDEPVDFRVAEILLRERQQVQRLQALPDCITALVLDFDGVFTNNQVVVFEDGTEGVVCNRGDGMGIALLRKLGFPILVLSTEVNPVVKRRCEKLGIECKHGLEDKFATLKLWLEKNNIDISRTVYVGNDVNDVECLQAAGCGITVKDAYREAQEAAHFVLFSRGGEGAIREVAELIMAKMEIRRNDTRD